MMSHMMMTYEEVDIITIEMRHIHIQKLREFDHTDSSNLRLTDQNAE